MNSTTTFLAAVALILALCGWIGARNRRKEAADLRRRFRLSFGAVPDKKMPALRREKVPAYYLRHPPEDGIDDITWNDLELDALYARMDATLSGAGEEYLYALLRSSVRGDAGKEASCCRELSLEQIRFFEDSGNEECRIALQMALARFGHSGSYSIYDYLDLLDEVPTESNLRHLPVFLLPACSIAVLFASVPAGVVCLIASLCLNMVTYYRRRGEIEPYIVSFAYLLRMLRCAQEVCGVACEVFAKEQEELKRLWPSFQHFRRGSGILLSGSAMTSGNPIDILADYIRILFHVDLIKFNTMLSEAQRLRDEIDEELTILGKMDAAISLASFEKSLPYTCDPEWREETVYPDAEVEPDAGVESKAGVESETEVEPDASRPVRMAVEGVYHPLLRDPVPNDIALRGPILLTGSNASGKSTFLKALAICALLAQTVGFCPARSYAAGVYRIRSSMALRDSIQSGESYFMAEIRSLKRIADLSWDGGRPVLCCIDEVLRGTNTVERIAASSEILLSLARKGVLCCAATHDGELSGILSRHYDNYHFEEELKEGDVAFSYRLHTGRATSRNAIRLLDAVGFDTGITSGAQRRAEEFEKTGEWR